MRSAVVLIAIILAASAAGIHWSDSAAADMCSVHFDYQPRGDYYTPAYIGQPLLRENIQFLIDMGSWHLENGDPWDPDAPITGDTLIIIDERPEPIPTPDPPAPSPEPSPEPSPTPKPSPSEESPEADLTIYAPFAILVGGLAIAILWALHSRK